MVNVGNLAIRHTWLIQGVLAKEVSETPPHLYKTRAKILVMEVRGASGSLTPILNESTILDLNQPSPRLVDEPAANRNAASELELHLPRVHFELQRYIRRYRWMDLNLGIFRLDVVPK